MHAQTLHTMYQQWQQDNENYVLDWLRFVELVAREHKTTEDQVIKELQKHRWFHWPHNL
jgi:hypothetical protein